VVEKFGVNDPAKGQRRCIVIAPKKGGAGQSVVVAGLLLGSSAADGSGTAPARFHIAYISANATFETGEGMGRVVCVSHDKHGLSAKPAFIGMSRGGEYAYTWATAHPDKVSCIYGDNPGTNRESLSKLGDLAANDVPLLHVCGSIDRCWERTRRSSRASISSWVDAFP
jgi:hypothetical protein